jgi:hypothetical protein
MKSKFKYLVLEVNRNKDYISSCKVKNQLNEEIITILFEDTNKTEEMLDIICFIDIHNLKINDEFIKI